MIPLVVAVVLSGAPVGLPESPAVRLELPAGELPFDSEALANLLRLELGERTVLERPGDSPRPAPIAPRILRVLVTPSGANTVMVTLVRPAATAETHAVELGELPDEMKARALALAIGEFARASPTPVVETTPPPASPSPPQAQSSSRPITPLAEAGLRSFPSQGTSLLELRGGLDFIPLRQAPWSLRMDLSLLMGQQQDTLGVAQMLVPTATLGLRMTGSVADLRMQLGPQVEVGHAFVLVTADQGARANDMHTWIATAALAGGLGMRIPGGMVVQLGVQLGYALRGIELRADDRAIGGIGGPMFGVTLGAEFARDDRQ